MKKNINFILVLIFVSKVATAQQVLVKKGGVIFYNTTSKVDTVDLIMKNESIANYYTEGLTTQTPGKHYKRGFKFRAEIYNSSPDTVNDVSVLATFKNVNAGIVGTSISPIKAIEPYSRDTIAWSDSTLLLPWQGDYTATLFVRSSGNDPDSSNNSINKYRISIKDSVFARDNGHVGKIISEASQFGSSAEGFAIANKYTLESIDTVTSISVYLGKETTPGASFEVRVLDANMKLITSSDIYEVQGNDPGTFIRIPFPRNSSIYLQAGTYYAATYCYELDQTIIPVQKICFVEDTTIVQPTGVSMMCFDSTWYPTNSPWLMRMIMWRDRGCSCSAGTTCAIHKSNINLYQNLPNPFNGVSTINYSVVSADKVTLTVTDVTGRKVTEINEGAKTAGSYQVSLNAGDFNKGIYFYTLTVGATSLTKKMVITQ